MHKLGWKENYFKSADVSMLCHGCGVSQYPQFYDRTKNIYQVLPRPYVGIYSGEKFHQFLPDPWIIALEKYVEHFVTVSISDIPSVKYCQNLGKVLDTEKEKIPKKCRIGDTCFTSLANIGVNLYTRHPETINHIHKEVNDIMSVVIILGTDVRGGETVF